MPVILPTHETKAGESQIQGQAGQFSEALSQNR